MKIALIALAGLIPALASADDPKPYVVYQGRQVRNAPAAAAAPAAPAAGGSGASENTPAARQTSAFGTSSFQAGVSPGRSGGSSRAVARPSARSFRGAGRASGKRGITGPGGVPSTTPASTDAPPPYAVPGAKIISAGQQPVYSDPGNGGTHSVEGGGFIAIDQSKAHDVGRAPGITWAPPDTPPSASRTSGGGGSGASANGPSPVSTSGGSSGSSGPGHISGTGNGGDNNQGNNGNGSGGNGNNGGDQNNATGFNPAF